jgi:FkbM family methyltransferase
VRFKFRKHIIVASYKSKTIGGSSLKVFGDRHRSNPRSRKANRVLFIVFEMITSFISRMHIIGIVKQVSVTLERRLRSVASALSRNILLRNHIVSINCVKYYLSDERLESLVTLFGEYEKYVWEYFVPKLGEVFIDVGAHVGKYSLRVARIVGGEGLVIAVEPHPGNYQALLKGIQLNDYKNVIALNVAAWDKNCRLKLFIHDASVHHSAKIDLGLGYVEVDARTIDQVVEDLDVKRVDWIKIDVEDAETEVIKGLEKTLAKYNPRLIIEVQWKSLREIRKLMDNYHYTVVPIPREQNPKAQWGYFYCEPLVRAKL